MIRPHGSAFVAPLLLVGSMLSLTIGASIAKGLFPVLGAAGASFLRLGLATIMLFVVWRPWRFSITRQQLGIIALYGSALGLMNLTFYESIARLPIGIALALEFLGPLSVAFFMSKGRLDILWAVLALVGVFLILPLTKVQARLDVVGIIFAAMAATAWASYILIGKKAGAAFAHAGTVTALGMAFATLIVAPFGVKSVWQVTWDGSLVVAVLTMALLSSAIPYSLEMAALKRLDSKTFGILLSLEPAFGALMALLLLHERITLVQCFAIGGVVVASVGSAVTSRRQNKDVTSS